MLDYNYSFSQDRIYRECPNKYQLIYIKKLKEPTSPAMELGNNIHRLAELKAWDDNRTTMPVGNAQAILKVYERLMHEKNKGFVDRILKELKEFYKDKTILFTEPSIIVDGIIFKIDVGYIPNLVSGELIIADYKVTKNPKTIDSIFDEAQLLCYNYSITKGREQFSELEQIKDIKLQYININSETGELSSTKPLGVSFETCNNFINTMKENMQSIKDGKFPKNTRACKNYGKECFFKRMGYCNG